MKKEKISSDYIFLFTPKRLKRFMDFVWFYQPKGKRDWKHRAIKEWRLEEKK